MKSILSSFSPVAKEEKVTKKSSKSKVIVNLAKD